MEPTKLEPLNTAYWGVVLMISAFDQLEQWPEPLAQGSGIVANHRQTAAPFRPIERKRADDQVAAGAKSPHHTCNIGVLVGRLGQEVERCAIMP
jgi:hypothetical protein